MSPDVVGSSPQERRASSGPARLAARAFAEFARSAPWQVWTALVATWTALTVATVVARVQFAPDSRYYVAMTYHFLGYSQEDSRAMLEPLTSANDILNPPVSQLFGWGLVQPRIAYPLLSTPFVAIGGTRGMVIVPILSMAILTFASFGYLVRRFGVVAALVPVGLMTLSSYLMFYGTAMLTESLTAVFILGVMATLPIWRERSRASVIWCGVLIVAASFTRQSWMLPVGAIVAAWLGATVSERSWRNRWTAFMVAGTVAGIGTQVFQSIVWPSFSILEQLRRTTGATTWSGAIIALKDTAAHILYIDTYQMLHQDRALLTLLLAAAVAAVALWRRPEAHLYAGMIAAGFATNVVNGTPTQFRYEMPGVSFVLLVLAAGTAAGLAKVRVWESRQAKVVDSPTLASRAGQPGSHAEREFPPPH
ncbi:MAG: hypothetical protein KQH57_04255 [Actinomycetales bacterium]|nr:hypothetical protein [Actinomycetales bacterium]